MSQLIAIFGDLLHDRSPTGEQMVALRLLSLDEFEASCARMHLDPHSRNALQSKLSLYADHLDYAGRVRAYQRRGFNQ